MMLRHINEKAAADKLEAAVAETVAEGKSVTYDLRPGRDVTTAVGTSEMADAIIASLK
jgi:isocitrate dehydrogenase (NAD+)